MNSDTPEEKAQQHIRRLIWAYFWLLIVEGALRKWVLPQLSNPLLVIRDPVALLIFMFSFRARVFPNNIWTVVLIVIALISTAATFIQLSPYFPLRPLALVTGYGIHANFFHLPLIFIIAKVMRLEDIRRIGWWTLLVMVPMTLLMVAQFQAAPDAFVNHTAGGGGEMMMAALGKVRTAGSFSFVIGVVFYFSLAVAFLLWGVIKPGVYRIWLMIAAGAALIIGTAVSGSRSVVASCALVIASLLVVFVVRRDAVNRLALVLMATLVLGFLVSLTPIFREGLNVLTTRFSEVAEQTDQSIARGLIERVFSVFGETAFVFNKAPFFGYGLGIGTNAGANILTGNSMFLLTEGEWSRIILESGPLVGLVYIFWRFFLTAHIGWACLLALKRGNVLPLFLFTAGFVSLLNGQFGQPTILGFAVFTMGLALAAARHDEPVAEAPTPPPSERGKPMVRKRSPYAEKMHASAPASDHSNGAADR